MNYENIMVDLETLDTKPGAIILSIGACKFNDAGVGEAFYIVINTGSCEAIGLTKSEATVEWWNKQALSNPMAAEVITGAAICTISIHTALNAFNDFIGSENKAMKLWGNGSDFDNVILLEAYRRCNITPAWGIYNNRCYRTVKCMLPGLAMTRTGTHHNAMDDAINQARHMIDTLHAYGIQVSTIS